MAYGQLLDFSAALIDPSAIKAAGYTGVIGYMSPSRPGSNFGAKPLPREYCDRLRAAGLEIVSVWQYGKPGGTAPSDWTTGRDGGLSMGHQAAALHAASGGPDGAPIYFAVDEDITLEQWNGTGFEYFRGVADAIGIDRTGIYGHSRVCAWAAQDGVIGTAPDGKYWAWQTKAWSAGEVAPEAVLYQFEIDSRTVGGVGVDVNDALAPHYGQWSDFAQTGGDVVTAPTFTELDLMGNSRDSRNGQRPIYFLLHTQEGNGTAESLAAYLNNTANGASYHYTVDNSGTVCAVVDTDYASWSVLDANALAINLCFAGSFAKWGPTQWVENMGRAIDIAAYIAVQDCRKYGIPVRIITPQELGDGAHGIADHWAITEGLGIGTHTDVGDGFPWDRFARALDKYNAKESAVSVADDELSKKFASRSKYRDNDDAIDTLAGFVLNIDARIHEEFVEREALKGVSWAVALVKRQADAGDEGARAVFAQIQKGQS
jgi:N-acetyl-anhydromuramyl-L-alanine amidase AmpD